MSDNEIQKITKLMNEQTVWKSIDNARDAGKFDFRNLTDNQLEEVYVNPGSCPIDNLMYVIAYVTFIKQTTTEFGHKESLAPEKLAEYERILQMIHDCGLRSYARKTAEAVILTCIITAVSLMYSVYVVVEKLT